MTTKRRLAKFAVLSLLCVAPTSCIAAAVAAGAAGAFGAIKYSENGAYRDFHTDVDAAWRATSAALAEYGYQVPANANHDATGGKIDAGDTKASVSALSEGGTRVEVRVGTFSTEEHERKAALVLNAIAKRLGG